MPEKEKAHLTVLKGGKITPREFLALPFADKLQVLPGRPAKEQRDLIVADPEGQEITRSLPPFSLYLAIKELGENDAVELINYASPEQLMFFLDLDLWKEWSFSADKAFEWLEWLLDGGEDLVAEFVNEADPELLALLLMNEITVGGGVGVLASDDERLETWDHSFDQLYFITFRNQKHARRVGTFLDIIFRRNNPLYQTLMERVKTETVTEMEEVCFRGRSGRLADAGFPEPDDALSIYVFVNPDTFRPRGEKAGQPAPHLDNLPLPLLSGGTLLHRLLDRLNSRDILVELNYLISNALVADRPDFSDTSAVSTIMERVYGYLNIALEFLSEGDEEKGTAILEGEYLKDLFRVGFSLVLQLRRQGDRLASHDYAVGKVLSGLKAKRPRYFRGLDPDAVDSYREFRELADVRKTAALLEKVG